MTMYEWNGSIWVARQRVFIGELTTGASSVTNFATYAYERRYQSPWTTVGAGTTVNFTHNLGMSVAEAESRFTVYGRINASAPPTFAPSYLDQAGTTYGILHRGGTKLNQIILTGSLVYFTGGIWYSTADLMASIESGW